MLRYEFDGEDLAKHIRVATSQDEGQQALEKLQEYLRKDTIGHDLIVKTPFGVRRVVYADFTASGRALGWVENVIREQVLPSYGNTHTLSTATARQSTFFRSEARQIIKHYLNATHEDALIFCGSGTTGAVHKFVEILCRSHWALQPIRGDESVSAGSEVKDNFLREDRWGTYECTLCGVRVKTEAVYRSHCYSEMHQRKLQESKKKDPFEGSRRIVILCDPLAHHSSLLPFRELTKMYPHASTEPILADSMHSRGGVLHTSSIEMEVCTLKLDPDTGMLCQDDLAQRLSTVKSRKGATAICVLCAGSNVTGLLADVPKLTKLAHEYGAYAFWDYAATAGHLRPDLNPPSCPDAAVDAAFFSPHKLLGGPGTVGLLLAKKRLLRNAVPAVVGGGNVFFVEPNGHSYIQNAEDREEAGTPSIVACIRTGLVYHLHTMLPQKMMELEADGLEMLLRRWSSCPRIELLGHRPDVAQNRCAIISFMVRYGNYGSKGLYLHYNYVVALLNDLFGIQARGGCACAGPYGQALLGIDQDLATVFDQSLKKSAQEVLRPGFVRVGVHFTMSKPELEILASAVEWVARNGWRLLPAYTFSVETGEWHHRLASPQQDRAWLSAAVPPAMEGSLLRKIEASIAAPKSQTPPENLLEAADAALITSFKGENPITLSSTRCPSLEAEYADLLWFALPTDAAATLQAGGDHPALADDGAAFIGSESKVNRVEHSVFSISPSLPDENEANASTAAPPSDACSVANEPENSTAEAIEAGEWGCEFDDQDEGRSEVAKPTFSAAALHPNVTKPLRSQVAGAIKEYDMIKEGDRLLVGLSGGKDSLCMLHVLLELQKRSPVKFTIAAATINPETPEYSPHALIDYMEALGVPYHFVSKPLIQMAKDHIDPKKPSICSFCARMKRGLLYSCMRENGYNVLCLGQHLDDMAESFLMSLFRNGALRTMKANYHVEDQDIRVCRPLAHVREKTMTHFAKENRLPIITDNCPACFAAPKERHRVKMMLSQQEFEHPDLFWSLMKGMKPLMSIAHTDKNLDFARIVDKGDPLDEGADAILPKAEPKKAASAGAPSKKPDRAAAAARAAAAGAAAASKQQRSTEVAATTAALVTPVVAISDVKLGSAVLGGAVLGATLTALLLGRASRR